MITPARNTTPGTAITLCCVFLFGLAISTTVILSLISVYLLDKSEDLAKLAICTLSFARIITQNAHSGPSYIDNADFNHDNIIDLVIDNYNDGTLTIALGNSDGTFKNQVQVSAGDGQTKSNAFDIGDINQDGNLDLVVVNSGTSNVGVLLGNGDGSFATPTRYSTGNGSIPLGLALKDLNDDNNLDLVVTDNANHVVLIFLGSKMGTFILTTILSTGSNSGPYGVVIEDFNRDTQPDIGVSNARSNQVSIFLNTGAINFVSPKTCSTGTAPYSIITVDLNKDRIFDIVTTNYFGHSISVLFGNGDGSFKEQKMFSTGSSSLPYSLYFGDFNRDTNIDIVVVNSGTDKIGIFLGNGHGNFRIQRTYSTGTGTVPIDVKVADYNNDGRSDIVTANFNTNTFFIDSLLYFDMS